MDNERIPSLLRELQLFHNHYGLLQLFFYPYATKKSLGTLVFIRNLAFLRTLAWFARSYIPERNEGLLEG